MAHKAYGRQHQRTRTKLLRAAVGTLCPICGLVMNEWEPLDLDHADPTTKQLAMPGDRITHATCNRSRGANSRIPARNTTPSRDW